MSIEQPRSIADLEPPFKRVGEPGWDLRLKQLLRAYGVPESQVVSPGDLVARERVLGFRLPEPMREFLLVVGPVDFHSMRVLALTEIAPMADIWFASRLPDHERTRLPDLVAIMDYYGTGDFIAWDRESGRFVLVRHDPVGICEWLPTFDECIREQCINLAVGYFGWPDPNVERLVELAKKHLLRHTPEQSN